MQMLQRHISANLDMDNATYSKIEKGDFRVKRAQIPMIVGILQTDAEELLILWLADKVMEVLNKEKDMAEKVLKIVTESLIKV